MADFILNVKLNGVEQSVSTIGELEQALQDTNKELSQIDESSKDFKVLTDQAKSLDKALQTVSKDASEFNKQLKGVDTQAKQLNTTFNTTTQAAAELGTSTGVDNLTGDIQQASNSSASLRLELRKVTQELQGLEPGSARFTELSNRAGELRDKIADTNAVINATAGTTTERFGKALASTAQIGVAGFQAIQGAQALFGVENEEVQQAMLKLQALLNLSQAIQTFGSLGDRITEIRAGMGLLSTATATQATVTNVATGATTGLNIAMRALPIFAIISGLAILGSAVFSYLNRTKEATKEEKERAKNLENLKKVQAEGAKFVAKETTEFQFLIFQLQNSNKNSKERTKLIKEINDTYGTTLKNIQDEVAFQKELNLTVEEYVNFQKNRFKLQKNLEYQTNAQEQLNKAEQEQAKYLAIFNKEKRRAGDVITYYDQALGANTMTTLKADETLGAYRDRMGLFDADLIKVEATLRKYNTQIEELNKRRLQLLGTEEKLTDNGKKYGDGQDKINKNTTVSNKLAADETALAIFKNDLKEDEIKLIDEVNKTQAAKTTTTVDDLELEQEIALRTLRARYDAAIKTNKEEVKDKRKSKNEEFAITAEFTRAEQKLTDDFKNKKNEARTQEAIDNQNLLDKLKLQNEILNSEILFGDENVADQKDELRQRELALEIKALDDKMNLNTTDLNEFEILQQKKLELQGEYAVKTLAIQTKVAENTRVRDLNNYIALQESLLGVTIVQNKKLATEDDAAFEARLKKEGEYNFKRLDGTVATLVTASEVEKQSYANIIKQKENLDERYAADVIQLTNTYVEEASNIQTEGDKKTLDKRLAYLNQYFSEASKALSAFNNTTVSGLSAVVTASLTGIQEYFKLVDQDFASLPEKISAYATAIGGILNGLLGAFVQQNQALLDQELNRLQVENDARKDALTTRYNEEVALERSRLEQGLIDREEYRAAIEGIDYRYNESSKALDKDLQNTQRKEREKAFRQEKNLKIAQTIISGLQGAISAFTGALTLPFPAGPIVGGILAAAVGTLTGINVAQIRKTELSGTTVQQASTTLAPTSTSSSSAGSALSQAGGGFTSFSSQATGTPQNTLTTTGFESSGVTKVVVVESDITAAQNRVRVLESNSTFG